MAKANHKPAPAPAVAGMSDALTSAPGDPGADFGASGFDSASVGSASADAALNAERVPGDQRASAALPPTAGAAKFASKRVPYALEDNVPMPEARRGSREALYPFSKMNVGQRFFVPVTADNPEPWKNMPSIASRATRTHWPKQFESRRIENPPGVGVWRVADNADPNPPAVRAKGKKS